LKFEAVKKEDRPAAALLRGLTEFNSWEITGVADMLKTINQRRHFP